MKKLNKRELGRSGFTLIEVVLVLAIGGLIFLLAFLAFGQATQNRRDTQRRTDAAKVITELENASGDSNGRALGTGPVQEDLNDFLADYFDQEADDGDNQFTSNNIQYTLTYGDTPLTTEIGSNNAEMAVTQGGRCDGNRIVTGGGPGDYAVVVRLEKGVACRDNQ